MSCSPRHISLAIAVALLVGCNSAPPPPGFSRVGRVIQQQGPSNIASPAAIYSLMEWYLQANATKEMPHQWREYVEEQREKAIIGLQTQWQLSVISQTKNILKPDSATFLTTNPDALKLRTDWETLQGDLRLTELLIKTPYVIQVPVNECTQDSLWSKELSTENRDAFKTWANQRALPVPVPKKLNTQIIGEQLDACKNAVALKQKIYEKIASAQSDAEAHKYLKAMDDLKGLQDSLKNQTLDAIHDTATLPALQQEIQQLPVACLKYYTQDTSDQLKQIEDALQKSFSDQNPASSADNALTQLEFTLSEQMTTWAADDRFAHALPSFASTLNALIARCLNARAMIWKHSLTTQCEKKYYWDAYCTYIQQKSHLRDTKQKQLALYHSTLNGIPPQAEELAKQLDDHYLTLLPQASDELLTLAEKESTLPDHFGYAFAIATMAKKMLQCVPNKLNDSIARADACLATTTKLIKERILTRTISVSDMVSAIPGLGLTYTRDVTYELEKLVQLFGLATYVSLATSTSPQTQYNYTLRDGVVADFDGTESSTRQSTRTLRRYDVIKMSPNPELAKTPEAPPIVYTQEVYNQIIHIREVERLAHIRAFITLHAPDKTSIIECNEFYPKRFTIEETHPFDDRRVVDIIRSYDVTTHPAQDPAPELRYDRVWTPGEILDWARKDAVRIFALKLVYQINDFPLFLHKQATIAEDNANLDAATEYRAYCALLMESINQDNNPLEQYTQTPVISQAYPKCKQNFDVQKQAISALKQTALEALFNSANKLYRSHQLTK